MNYQETFDKVTRHLVAQGKRAMNNEESSCEYFAPDGTKCAVGALLPNWCEQKELPASLTGVLHDPLIKLALGITDDSYQADFNFLRDLQRIHDNILNWVKGAFAGYRDLVRFATQYGLSAIIVYQLHEELYGELYGEYQS